MTTDMIEIRYPTLESVEAKTALTDAVAVLKDQETRLDLMEAANIEQDEAKKNQKVIQIKEIKMRPAIGEQDYRIKFNRAVGFLKEGKRVKFTLQFRGRQMIMMRELGDKHFARVHQDLLKQDLGPLVEEILQRGRPFWSKIYYVKGS